jgi:hypothetical protein
MFILQLRGRTVEGARLDKLCRVEAIRSADLVYCGIPPDAV